MKRFSILALIGTASVWAGQPDYFPLHVGDQWVLQTTSLPRELLSIEVVRSRVQKGETYFLVAGYAPEPRWVRQTPGGMLVALDEQSAADQTLAHLSAGAPGYSTSLSGCEQLAQPSSATAPHRGTSFDFEESLTLAYLPGPCRDVGIKNETYAPAIGLTQRSITTIRGEVTFDLVYARVNGLAVLGKSKEIVLVYDFNHGSRGWLAGFTDYHFRTADLRMLAELRTLPDEVDQNRSGFFIQSMNRSDDLFMFLKKNLSQEDGLEPNRRYLVSFEIGMASNAPSGCFGAGGAPGESVYLKAGASADEPLALLGEAGDVRLSIDKGQQSVGGKDAGFAGTIANGTNCDGSSQPYISLTRAYVHSYPVQTDDRASMWLLTGTDSGYEGLTGLYFESITVRINAAVDAARLSPAWPEFVLQSICAAC